jgi:hypothetical protein
MLDDLVDKEPKKQQLKKPVDRAQVQSNQRILDSFLSKMYFRERKNQNKDVARLGTELSC